MADGGHKEPYVEVTRLVPPHMLVAMFDAIRERATPFRAPWAAAVYAATIAVAVLLFLLIRAYGAGLTAPPPMAPTLTAPAMPGPAPDALAHLLIALTAIVIVGRVLRKAFQAIGQPPVIGEVVAGVLLGPSLLGAISPAAYQFVLAPSAAPYLGIVAQLGVVLYMFLVGVELNPDVLRGQVHATVATSHASIVVPFVLGSALALFLYPRFSSADVPFTSFALFIGITMSITAFPVLARILSELGMTRTPLGTVALACAAVDDVTAWCLLALVVGVVQASAGSALTVIALTVAFIAVMFVVVRPWLGRLIGAANGEWSDGYVAVGIVGLLISALVTEAIGIHALFGAFLFGAVIPHDSRLAHALTNRLESLVARAAAAGVLRVCRHAHRDRPRPRLGRLDRLCPDHRRRDAGQSRRHAGGGTTRRHDLAHRHGPRRADEHPGPDATGRPQRRSRSRRHHADAVYDDGRHGDRLDHGDHPARATACA